LGPGLWGGGEKRGGFSGRKISRKEGGRQVKTRGVCDEKGKKFFIFELELRTEEGGQHPDQGVF